MQYLVLFSKKRKEGSEGWKEEENGKGRKKGHKEEGTKGKREGRKKEGNYLLSLLEFE